MEVDKGAFDDDTYAELVTDQYSQLKQDYKSAKKHLEECKCRQEKAKRSLDSHLSTQDATKGKKQRKKNSDDDYKKLAVKSMCNNNVIIDLEDIDDAINDDFMDDFFEMDNDEVCIDI